MYQATLRALVVVGWRWLGEPVFPRSQPKESDIPGTRPLTDLEIGLCRKLTTPGLDACRLALGEATATTAEMVEVAVSDLDSVDNPTEVRLPDSDQLRGRVVALTPFGVRVIRSRVAELDGRPDAMLAYEGDAESWSTTRQSAACRSITRYVLDPAGLASDRRVRPVSIRYWRAISEANGGASRDEIVRLMGTDELPSPVAFVLGEGV